MTSPDSESCMSSERGATALHHLLLKYFSRFPPRASQIDERRNGRCADDDVGSRSYMDEKSSPGCVCVASLVRPSYHFLPPLLALEVSRACSRPVMHFHTFLF